MSNYWDLPDLPAQIVESGVGIAFNVRLNQTKVVVSGVGRIGRRHVHAKGKTESPLVGVYDISLAKLSLQSKRASVKRGSCCGC
jgi:hypothetical protein